jgi:hypothetical protein
VRVNHKDKMKRHIIKIREIIKTLKSLLATANSSTADFQAKPFLDNIASLKHVPIEEVIIYL